MGKGSVRRPAQISKEEEDLRWKLALGQITKEEFDKELAKLPKKKSAFIWRSKL